MLVRIVPTLAIWLALAAGDPAAAAEPPMQPEQPPEAQAQAAPPASDPSTVQEPAAPKEKWQFATIGYVWFAGAWGKTDVIEPAEPVDLRLPFGKVLKAFKFAFMGAAEAKRDRIVVLGDLTFIHLGTSKGIGIRDPNFLKADLDSKTAEVTLLGGYRVANNGPVKVDLLAGGRMNWFNTSLQLNGPNRSAFGSVKQTWFDPLLAARVQAPLGGKWSFSAYGDVGGFGIASDITWQAVATVDYQISRKMSLGLGWRHFKVDYRNGDFLYDVYQTGPLITFRTNL